MMPTVRPLEKLLSLLNNVQTAGANSWKAYCPIHEDDGRPHDPSLSVSEAQDGKVLIHCFVCNATGPQVCSKLGLSIRELFPAYGVSDRDRKRRKIEGKKVAEYEYRDVDGVIQFKACRYETSDGKKTFAQFRPNGKGGWIGNMRGVNRIPYRLPELVAADKSQTVYIVEGEKKVEALRAWGLIATCNVGGAGKWKAEFAIHFRGRHVVILPDNDPTDPLTGNRPGMDHAVKVLASLSPVAESVRILELPDLPDKGDIVDWQAAGRTLAELLELTARVQAADAKPIDAKPVTPAGPIDPTSILVDTGRTDTAAGMRLITRHGQNLRYCHALRKWFVWTGSRWAFDKMSAVERWASQCGWTLWDEIEKVNGHTGPETVNKMKVWTKYANSWGGIISSIKSASTFEDVQVSIDNLDANPWLLNCRNGTVDLQTCELHEHTRDDMITKRTRVVYDPDADCPTWRAFLLATFRGDRDLVSYVQRLCGYWATGVIREQILPILWGGGSNGKTTFLNVLLEVLGRDYAMKAPQDFLMSKNHDSHPTEKADLFGKRLVFCSETEEGRRLSESLVKELTGTERVRARRMREDFWEFTPTHKIALVTNHKPLVTGGDHGIWRRIRLIEFGQKFWDGDAGESGPPELRQDKALADQLKLEYPGILRWILAGCQEWQRDGEQVPKAVRDQTSEYRDSQDSVGQWLMDCCDLRSNATSTPSELYGSFRAWCESNGEWVTSQKRFCATLNDRGFTPGRTNSTRFYRGIELLPTGYLS